MKLPTGAAGVARTNIPNGVGLLAGVILPADVAAAPASPRQVPECSGNLAGIAAAGRPAAGG